MAIEKTPAAANESRSHAAASPVSSGSRPKTAGSANGGAGPNDFASLLAAAEEPVSASSPAGEAAVLQDDPAAVEQKPTAGVQAASGSTRQDKDRGKVSAKPVGKDGSETGKKLPSESDGGLQATQTGVPVAQVGGILGMQLPVLALPGTAGASAGPVPEATDGVAVSSRAGVVGAGLAKTNQLQQSLVSVVGRAGLRTSMQAGPGASDEDGGASAASPASMSLSDGKDFRQLLAGKEPVFTPKGTESAVGMMDLVASVISRSEGQDSRRSLDDTRVLGGGAQDAQQAETPELHEVGGLGLATDEVVQEPVRFWLGSDSKQQAEMTVDDIAGGSVDVSIRMHGKEAQIVFRTDEALTRDALQSGSGQLKEMLGGEGLTLSGLSIGTSSGGNEGDPAGRQGDRDRRGARIGSVSVATKDQGLEPLVPSRPGAARIGGLDLFV